MQIYELLIKYFFEEGILWSLFYIFTEMFEFDQYLGLLFMTVVTIGFWLMILLLTFIIPYWVTGSFFEGLKKEKKVNNISSNPKKDKISKFLYISI